MAKWKGSRNIGVFITDIESSKKFTRTFLTSRRSGMRVGKDGTVTNVAFVKMARPGKELVRGESGKAAGPLSDHIALA